MDRPTNLTDFDLSKHPHHDAISIITICMSQTNPQSIEANKAANLAAHIYEDLFANKETQRTFYLSVAYLLAYVEETIEKKYGPKVPKAMHPAKEDCVKRCKHVPFNNEPMCCENPELCQG